jgi:C4-dicarboxylate-binding protein DctP
MLFFEKELEARSGGRIRVENYFSGTLGSEREMMDMVATGVLQGTRGGLFADANPKYVVFMLPFLIENWDQAIRLINSDFTAEINHGARDRGFHVPATGISQGFRAHTNNVRPIESPADLRDLKMRVPPQEIYVLTARAFGASPQELPASDIYSALKTGVLDGQDNPPSNIWDYKIYEVQDFMTITHYSTGPDPFIVSLEWYESLDADLQELFDVVATEAIRYSDELNRQSEATYVERLRDELIVNVLNSEQQQSFRSLVAPVYEHFIDSGVLTDSDIKRARDIAEAEQ